MAERQGDSKTSQSSKSSSAKDAAKKAAMMAESKQAGKTRSAQQAYIDEYTVAAGDTMGGIALKYYGSAVEEKWMAIYEANKALIGDNPRLIHPGQKLKIPKLPES